jgi:integrase
MTMQNNEASVAPPLSRGPWNKGKLVGAKPPLRPKHVWSIRTKLQIADRKRDLAMFNLAIDSKLRGCDVVALKVEDIAPHGYAIERATVRQKKTGVPVRFEVTEQTRHAVDDYIRAAHIRSRIACRSYWRPPETTCRRSITYLPLLVTAVCCPTDPTW